MGNTNAKMRYVLKKESYFAHNHNFRVLDLGRAYRIFCYLNTRDSENYQFRGSSYMLAFRTVWGSLENSMKIYYLTSGRYSRKLKRDDEIDAFAHTILIQGRGYFGKYSSDDLFNIPVPIHSTEECMERDSENTDGKNERPSKRRRR